METRCDNKSVGVVITNGLGEIALLRRGRFPIGMAPAAGHEDAHGSSERAAVEEVFEEIGLQIAMSGLKRTTITKQRVNNVCRRAGGDHHVWTVYEATAPEGVIVADADETAGANWYPQSDVQAFADRTTLYRAAEVSEAEWAASPGLEPVWLDFLVELGYVT